MHCNYFCELLLRTGQSSYVMGNGQLIYGLSPKCPILSGNCDFIKMTKGYICDLPSWVVHKWTPIFLTQWSCIWQCQSQLYNTEGKKGKTQFQYFTSRKCQTVTVLFKEKRVFYQTWQRLSKLLYE